MDCTIKRTFTSTSGSLNLTTGKLTLGYAKTVTAACGAPLFGDDMKHGVCRACRQGWEVSGNRFANDAERARALAS